MAGNDPDEIVIGANGQIRVAPVGTAAPADETAAPAVGWIDLGYASEDGVTFRNAVTLEDINVWQEFYAARKVVSAREASASFVLRQWNEATVPLAFGGGAVTVPTAGKYKYEPPDPADIDERALMIDWHDGDKDYRLIIPRGLVSDAVETQITKGTAADLPITFAVLGSAGVKPFYLLSNDPAFAA